MLCIVVQLHTSSRTLTERSISSKIDKPWPTLNVYSSKAMYQIYLKILVNVMFLPWFFVRNLKVFSKTNFTLHRHFKTNANRKKREREENIAMESYSARPYCPTDRRRVRRFVVLSSFPSRRWPLPSRRWPRPFSVETRNLWRRRTWAWTMYRPWRCLMPRPLRPRSALIQGRTLRRREALKWV